METFLYILTKLVLLGCVVAILYVAFTPEKETEDFFGPGNNY
ncbi:hypothetical protein [Mucilaginibacter phyllosphaerae]